MTKKKTTTTKTWLQNCTCKRKTTIIAQDNPSPCRRRRLNPPTLVVDVVVIMMITLLLCVSTAAAIGPKTTSNTTAPTTTSYLRSSRQLEPSGEVEDGLMMRVIVGFASQQASVAFAAKVGGGVTEASDAAGGGSSSIQGQQVVSLPRANAVALTIHKDQYELFLQQEEDAVYIEEDVPRVIQQQSQTVQDNKETIPYGIAMVQGDAAQNAIPMPSSGGGCLKVCVIDDGLQVGHPDLPFFNSNNVKGTSIGLTPDFKWNNPGQLAGHGTHIVGTMFAKGNNGMGVRGVIPNAQGMCLLVARVFGPSGTSYASAIAEAIEWCADNGARVINMSLGGNIASQTEAALFQQVWNEGILVVAAAGNSGGTELTFPASYPTVTSVAAVDENRRHASFSQSNAQVDIAAPGVNILSTSTASTVYVVHDQTSRQYEGIVMELSAGVSNPGMYRNVPTVNCQKGFSTCPNAQGKVCLIERGTTTFAEKARNCQQGGGVAAVVYNNATEAFLGTLDGGTTVTIPVMSLAGDAGRALLSASSVSFRIVNTGYATLSGTSMAVPHVTAVVAKIWAARPRCSSVQIRQAIYQSARDLGVVGRDNKYGHGLVQAVSAYNYLLKTFPQPCGTVLASGKTCQSNYGSCVQNSDCCSGDCRPMTVTASKCRPPAKLPKTKLGAKNHGGAHNRVGRRQRELSSLGKQELEQEPLQQPSIQQQQQQQLVSSRSRRSRRMIRGGGEHTSLPSLEFTNDNDMTLPDDDSGDDTRRKPQSPTGIGVVSR